MYKIVEKNNHNAVHSVGYFSKEKAQKRIDDGECKKYWINKDAEFVVIESVPRTKLIGKHIYTERTKNFFIQNGLESEPHFVRSIKNREALGDKLN